MKISHKYYHGKCHILRAVITNIKMAVARKLSYADVSFKQDLEIIIVFQKN